MNIVQRVVRCDACGGWAYPGEDDEFEDGQGCIEPGCGGTYCSEGGDNLDGGAK